MAAQGFHVVFLNMKATGHVNPTLPIVAEMKSRGFQITYFIDKDLKTFVEDAGATWRPFRNPDNDSTDIIKYLDEAGAAKYVSQGTSKEGYSELHQSVARAAELHLPGLLEDLRSLDPKPAVIVYDPFVSFARVAAHVLGIPAICVLTMPGPASMAKPKAVQEAWESEPWSAGPRQAVMDTYNFDIFEDAMPMEFYSPVLNLVTTIDELFQPPADGHQQERFGSYPFKMVGMLADSSVKRISNVEICEPNPDDENVVQAVDQALQEGRRAIYISLGTVATSDYFYAKPFGHFGRTNGLSDYTGKQVAQHIFRCCIEAFGDRDDLIVAMSAGPYDDILDDLPPLPANFIVRKALPQLELLKRCNAFVTHGGANSMHEGLGHGVPMVVVPFFGDQPINGDAIVRCGVGFNFRQAMTSLTTGTLQAAMSKLLEVEQSDGASNSYCRSARAMARKLADAGGAKEAVTSILHAVHVWKEPAEPRLLGRLQGNNAHMQKVDQAGQRQPKGVC